jgi:tetratricopeptide (TPR) repeat protein
VVQPQVASVLVGRDAELRELLEALDEAGSGRGRVVLIGGEPGIGKSRLADELATRARDRGAQVMWGRAWEDAGAPPYWPWVQALRAWLRATARDDVRRDVGSGVVDVVQILPELRDLFPDLPPPPNSATESARFQLFDSSTTLLRNIAQARPLLVVLDDLHAADTPSIVLLRFLATQLADMSVLVVGTYRDVELTPDHPLTSALADVAREPVARVMRLGGLPAEAVGAYIQSTSDVTPSDHLVAAVARATNGNPLFVGEAVRLLSAEGRLANVGDLTSLHVAVPPGIRAVIARRIGHLGAGTARALQLGSALGPEFSLEVLCRLGEYAPEEAIDLLDEAVAANLLALVAGARGRYRFSHDLVRETLYDETPPGRRARLHGRIAAIIEETPSSPSEARPAELAYHFAIAAFGGGVGPETGDQNLLAGKAVAYAMQAGDLGARSLAYEESSRLYRMALAALDVSEAGDDETRADLLLRVGDVESRAGNFDAARTAFLEAAELARRLGSGVLLARAAIGVGGRFMWARAANDVYLIPLLQDALVMLGGDDRRLRTVLLTRLACAWRSSVERRDDSAALSRQAVELAGELADPAALGDALIGRFWAIWWPENLEARAALVDEIRDVVANLDDERMADVHILTMALLIERGRLAEARLELEAVSHRIRELRQPAHLWLEHANRALLDLIVGNYADAEHWVGLENAPSHRTMPGRDDVASARSHLFELRREQGRVAEAEAPLRAAATEHPWYPFLRAELACLLVECGRDEEARVVFDELARDDFAAIYPDSEWLYGMSLASEACARLGAASAAATLYERLAPYAGSHAVGLAEGSQGAVDRYLGLLASTLGRLDDAISHLSNGQRVNEAMGARPWVAHCQHDLADVLRQRDAPGDRSRAAAHDRAAMATATQLGMTALADRIGGEAVAADATSASAGPIATFRREGEYWSVEFQGDAFRIRDSKGMRHLARLLASPGREIHALELARIESGGAAVTVGAGELSADGFGDAGPALDEEAVAAYRSRLEDIQTELAEAESWNDFERVDRLKAEEQALAHELGAAFGLGGRDRPAASAAERARVSVTRAIRAALSRIGEQSVSLGQHFEATIRTGVFCSYGPDPRAPITWRL